MTRNVKIELGAVLVLAAALLTALTASALARPVPDDLDRSFSSQLRRNGRAKVPAWALARYIGY